ncbi:MAG: thiamine-phosphate kinase [Rhodospirillales bacterium]|nr:thiamine-phosphate kinase [Rhodospirillales bacterium]
MSSSSTFATSGEFDLIARHFAPLAASEPGALGLLDDAAVIEVGAGRRLVVSTDALVAGVHFPDDEDAETAACRGLGAALSDLAAMGARPAGYTMALALPQGWNEDRREQWLGAFAAALHRRQAELAVALVGGDTVATTGPLWISLTVLGTVATGQELRRSAAEPGDVVWVSGSIGDAALGLKVIAGELPAIPENLQAVLVERFRRPQPRLALGMHLAGLAHGVADVSDGLIADLGHICIASRVTATIDAERVPVSAAAQAVLASYPQHWMTVVSGGDDYELVITASPDSESALLAVAAAAGTPLSPIGRVAAATSEQPVGVRIVGADGRDMAVSSTGYRHF